MRNNKTQYQDLVREKLVVMLLGLLAFILLGTVGFMYIESLSLVDALYMTIITLTTVGYGEIDHPFSEMGRLFTIFIILSGGGFFLYSVSIIGEEILSGRFIRKYNHRRMKKELSKLEGHVIICGFGRNGMQAAKTLKSYNFPVVVVEKNHEVVEQHENDKNMVIFRGDATEDKTLEEAGITKARALIATLPSDADNLYIVLSARQLDGNIQIISRASESNSVKKLKIGGANNVVMPDKIGGEHMASIISSPDLVEFLERISVNEKDAISMLEVSAEDLDEKDKNLTIKDVDIKTRTGCTVIGFKNKEKEFIINPDDTTILEEGTSLIVLGKPSQLEKLKTSYNLDKDN